MFSKTKIISAVASVFLSAFAIEVSAQNWSGDFHLGGGTNFLKPDFAENDFSNISGETEGSVTFKKKDFDINLYAGASSRKYSTLDNSVVVSSFEGGGDADVNMSTAFSSAFALNIKAGAALSYRFSENDNMNLGFSWNTARSKPSYVIFWMYFYENPDDPDDYNMAAKFYDKVSDNRTDVFNLTGSYVHLFPEKPGSSLEVKADVSSTHLNNSTVFDFGSSGEEVDTSDPTYRITPLGDNTIANSSIAYKTGWDNFKLDGFLKSRISSDMDYQRAATLKMDEWVDSLSYKADYDYLTLNIEPGVNFSFSTKKFKADGSLSLDGYTSRLNADLQGESHEDSFAKADIRLFASLGLRYDLSDCSTLNFKYGRSHSRPSYGNVFRFMKQGSYAEELITGNPDLKPTETDKFNLAYSFKKDRFSFKTGFSDTYRYRMIESTYNYRIIDDIEYRVFTWVNVGHSNTMTGSLSLGWSGESFNAGIGATLNGCVEYSGSGAKTQSSDYDINCSASYDFKYGFSVSADAFYQSDIRRTYYSKTGYVGLNAGVSKKFKLFDVFIKGNDLLDKPITTTIIAEDFSEVRMTESTLSRRVFLAGIDFKF